MAYTMTLSAAHAGLPDYVAINDPQCKHKGVLRNSSKTVAFPIDKETQKVIKILEAKYDQAENMAGLAAPQIGYGYRIIIFAVQADPDIQKFRPDLTDTLPKSIWINPSWKPLSDEMTTDWEACFSVNDLAGRVPRYTKIAYEAWTVDGKKVEGTAEGFLARVIQHETDHVNGKLFIDYVPEEELECITTLREERKKLLEESPQD